MEGIPVDLGVENVLRGMGADPEQMLARRPGIVAAANWALAEGIPLLEPQVLFSEYRIESLRHERLKLSDGKALSGPLLAQHLAAAHKVTAILCTLGNMLEDLASQVLAEEPLLGLALDGLGSAAIEALANRVCNRFEEQAAEAGLMTTIPLSPGMVGWPVETGQKQIFTLLDPGQIGVRLTEHGMMVPRKSLSMILGTGADLALKGQTCDYCNLKEVCRYQDHYH